MEISPIVDQPVKGTPLDDVPLGGTQDVSISPSPLPVRPLEIEAFCASLVATVEPWDDLPTRGDLEA